LNDLLSDDILAKLVGVIDLRDGHAVHAIAGDRDHYQSVDICGGDPVFLAEHYRQLGVTDLYVADLDAIIDGKIQVEAIEAVCRSVAAGRTLIDLGWTGREHRDSCDAIAALTDRHANVCWIAATESAETVAALAELAELISAERVFLGLDYRKGQLLGSTGEAEWIRAAAELGCCGVVILDLASVGTAAGPSTMEICWRAKRLAPRLSVVSGGGIRTAQDVNQLIEAGCDRCLVATALQV
jgi:phosphoribosylformimino-5-aminoimidazole carboxamide ribotide isomerase